LLHLGEVPDPATGKQQEDLVMAKQTIDLRDAGRENPREPHLG